MLPLSGLPPNAAVQRADDTLQFRINQRFAAQVVQIATDHVTLMVNDVPIVARLTDPAQAAQLAERRVSQFVVRDLGPHGLTLQLLPTAGGGPGPSTPAALADSLITALLHQANVPANEANAQIARALIARGLPVTAELINELQTALTGMGLWSAADAQLAAALKAAGLPLTAETMRLAREQLAASPVGDSLAQLSAKLSALANRPLPKGLAEIVQKARTLLDSLRVDWSQPSAHMAEQLHTSLATLGRSPEHALSTHAMPEGLLLLAQLRGEIAKALPNARDVIGQLDRFLDSARFNQLTNVTPHPLPPEGQLLNLPVPLRDGARPETPAHLRVACRQHGSAEAGEPSLTRLIMQLDVAEGQTVEVDLAVVGRQIGAKVTVTQDNLRAVAEEELPAFGEGLRALGFALKTARCETGWPRPAPTLADVPDPVTLVAENNPAAAHPHRPVNVEA
jgi:hypothetical protein